MGATPARPGVDVIPFGGRTPVIHPTAFIAPGCRIIGDVTIGAEASIWYNCVLRGDTNRIAIGARSNIQDGTVIHCDGPRFEGDAGFPALIGEDVLVGHMAMIHGCTLADRAFVGLGAVVMNGAEVASDAMLAAGALLPEGRRVPERELWAGRPARLLRPLDEAAVLGMRLGAAHYVRNAHAHGEAVAAWADVPDDAAP